MAEIVLPRSIRRPLFVGINPGSAQAQSLVRWYTFETANEHRTGKNRLSYYGTVRTRPFADGGLGYRGTRTSDEIGETTYAYVTGDGSVWANNTAFTTALWIQPAWAAASGGGVFSVDDAPDGDTPSLLLQCGDPNSLRVYWSGNYRMTFTNAWSSNLSRPVHIVFRFDGTTLTGFYNGVAQTYVGAFTNQNNNVYFNSGYVTTQGTVWADARAYSRALSDAEVYALYDPRTRYDLYYQPSRKIYFDIPKRRATTFPIPNVPGVSRELDLTLGTGIRPALFYLPKMSTRQELATGMRFDLGVSWYHKTTASPWGEALRVGPDANPVYNNSGAFGPMNGGAVTMLVIANPAGTGASMLAYTGVGSNTQYGILVNMTRNFGASNGRLAGFWYPNSYKNSTDTDSTTIVDGTYKVYGMVRTPGTACSLWVNGQKPAQTSNAADTTTYPNTYPCLGGWIDGSYGITGNIVLAVMWNHALPDSVMAQLSHPDLVMQRVWARRPAYLDAGEPATGRQSAAIIIPGRGMQRPNVRPALQHVDITEGMIACVTWDAETYGYDQINALQLTRLTAHAGNRTMPHRADGDLRLSGWVGGAAGATFGFRATTPAALKINPPISLAVWCREVAGSGTSTNRHYGISADSALALGIGAEGTVRAMDNTTPVSHASAALIKRGAQWGWGLAVVSVDAAGVCTTYYNGVRNSGPAGLISSGIIGYGTTSLYGVNPYSLSIYYSIATSDFWIWKRALQHDEVAALYAPNSRWVMYGASPHRIYHDLGAAAPTGGQGPRTYYYMGHVWSR